MIIPARIECDDCGRSVPMPYQSYEAQRAYDGRIDVPPGWTNESQRVHRDGTYREVRLQRCPRCARDYVDPLKPT